MMRGRENNRSDKFRGASMQLPVTFLLATVFNLHIGGINAIRGHELGIGYNLKIARPHAAERRKRGEIR
jgi:hypothetical protein